ncbi:hypothetical protein LMG19087_02883 [Ralstonia wenshanensis]|nr:hypothetical protein LMG19087_02883 [Ralstonia wenshanensis]
MNPVQQNLQLAFIQELLSRYDQAGPGRLLSVANIDAWTKIVGSTRRHAYDVMGRHLAIGFHEDRFSFGFCDAVANAVIGFVYDDFLALGEDSWPALFYQVYLAFDAGEVGPPGVDPISVYTRPMIARIVSDLPSNTG